VIQSDLGCPKSKLLVSCYFQRTIASLASGDNSEVSAAMYGLHAKGLSASPNCF
jgi:hypothetical protein